MGDESASERASPRASRGASSGASLADGRPSAAPAGRVLLVHDGRQRWAVPLDRVMHVGPMAWLTRLPNASPILLGVVAFRGDVVPVYDLFGLQEGEPAPRGEAGAGMLLMVRRAQTSGNSSGSLTGLRVTAIEEIGSVLHAGIDLLDVDALPFPVVAMVRSAPGNAAEPKVAPPGKPIARGLRAMLADRALWLPLSLVVEVIDQYEAIAVPWADPCVPEMVIRGGAALPVVRIDQLMDAGPGQATRPSGPLIVVRRKAGLLAFRVDEIAGIAPQSIDLPALDLDALLAKLPVAGAPPPVRTAAAAARTDQARAYLSFMLAGQPCLLPMHVIRAIADHARPATLPRAGRDGAATLAGLRAIRGQILPVVDPRGALGLPQDQVALADIVVAADGLPSFVVPAQSVDGVVRLTDDVVHETGRRAIIGGVVQLAGRLTWVLTPAALAASANDAARDTARETARETARDIARGAA